MHANARPVLAMAKAISGICSGWPTPIETDTHVLQVCSEAPVHGGLANGLSDWGRRPVRPAPGGKPSKRFSRPVSAFAGRWDGGGSRPYISSVKQAIYYSPKYLYQSTSAILLMFVSFSPAHVTCRNFKKTHRPPHPVRLRKLRSPDKSVATTYLAQRFTSNSMPRACGWYLQEKHLGS